MNKTTTISSRLLTLVLIFWGAARLLGADAPAETFDSDARARWNACEFGARADEAFDSTPGVQKALDLAGAAGGGVVELPSGRFRFDGVLKIPSGVTLLGTYRVPPTVVNKDEKPTGTTLLTYANRGNPTGEPFIELKGSNSALVGVVVSYPEWSMEDVPPVPYPPCVASENTDNVGVIDCCLLNPYEGIRFHLAHRHLVRNVTGYPIKRGLFVDECYDIGHIENIHFWPFGVNYRPDDPYCEWVNLNGVAFEFARTDWHYVSNTFCFGYGVGYLFSDCGRGGTNGNFLGIGADSCRRAVLVEHSQRQGILITNGEFVGRWTSEDSICLEIGEENEGAVSLTNCSFWGPVQTCVLSKQEKGRLTLNACEFVNWDEVHSSRTPQEAPAVQIDAGRASLVGNSFEKSGTHLKLGADVQNVVAVGNQAPGGFRVVGDKSPQKFQASGNELDSMELDPRGKENYRVDIGAPGDDRFVRNWFLSEERSDGSYFRWSTGTSYLAAPMPDELKPIVVEIQLDAPKEAFDEDAEVGVYLHDKKIADFQQGANRVVFELNPTEKDVDQENALILAIKCRAWAPKDYLKDSDDKRKLGVSCTQISVRTLECDDSKYFDANKGVWREERER